MRLIKSAKSNWIDRADWLIISAMQASSSAVLTILASVSLLACGADTPATPDARIVTPRPDARTLPDARFGPFVDAMNMPDAALACDDPSEPNNSENMATALTGPVPFTDCDDTGGAASGALDSADEDWFSYSPIDTLGCTVDPTVSIATGNVEVCLFLKCMKGTEEITCPSGTTATTVGTIDGCCGTGEFEIDFDCDGPGTDNATNFIRVKSMSQETCEPYTIGYHY